MAEPLVWTASASWGVASAVGVMALGAASWMGARSRPRGALPFGAFALTWGMSVGLGNLAGVVQTQQAVQALALLSVAFVLPAPYLLVEFAASQHDGRHTAWRAARGGAALTSLGAATVFALDPTIYLLAVVPGTAFAFVPVWTPTYAAATMVPLFLGLLVVHFSLLHNYLHAPTPRLLERSGYLLLGLDVYLLPTAAKLALLYAGVGGGTGWIYVALFGAILAVALRHVVVLRRAPPHDHVLPRRRMGTLLAILLLLGATEGALNLAFDVQHVYLTGVYRLAAVAIIAYGLARWRIHDLPRIAARATKAGSAFALAGLGGLTALVVGTFTLPTALPAPVLAVLVTLGLLVPAARLTRKTLESDRTRDIAADTSYGSRVDAYRAALEASMARGTLDEDEPFLRALRERFRIEAAEERLLRHYARTSVIRTGGRGSIEAYERLRLLGEGGAGRTWLARDRAQERLVVLKEPLAKWRDDPALRSALVREARLAARIVHDNVVRTESVVEGQGNPLIVMEYVDGGSLDDLLRERGTLPWREATTIMSQVLAGLAAIHAAGIIHRDIKPSNILLGSQGPAKIADFGIAMPQETPRGTQLDLGSPTRAGTPSYLAPEVSQGIVLGDVKADIYACGAVLHECLYGGPPATAPVVVREDVPTTVAGLVAQMLSARPEDRPASARELSETLRQIART